ncbi:ATP-binding protein [Rhizobium leguminosarum]|uniref:ATP-binding protein n=1 Tax=Rhizobium leguminosarum TaxID=384 RepID=UPI001C97C282|nr:ATP-binding protein [Rhizobium leguminosarum]MBY5827804.1 AAA family ATPase [Rhizobium leguminosarum]
MKNALESIEAERSLAAIQHIRDQLEPERLAINDRLAQIWKPYLPLARDELLHEAFKSLVDSVTTPIEGRPDKRRILAICGRSGAGKTSAIAKHISMIKEMQPHVDADGVKIFPTIVIETPSPCIPRLMALAGLEALGHVPKKRISESDAWLEFRRLLKVHKVMWVVFDEAQNAIENANVREAAVIGNNIKSLTQQSDWPVRVILAGVAPLASFLARKQLYNRRTVVPLDTLDMEANTGLVELLIQKIVVDHAGLKIGFELHRHVLQRLMHACACEYGSIIQMIRAAAELPIRAGRDTLEFGDFVRTYESFSGCRPKQNVFLSDKWEELDPTTALLKDEDRQWEESRKRSRGRNATKYMVRPQ